MKIHSSLAKQAFNAYNGFTWGEKLKDDKDLSDDRKNIAFFLDNPNNRSGK